MTDGASVGATGVEMTGPADLLAGWGGRQRGPGESHQPPDGRAEPGVAQGLGEGTGVLAAFPEEAGEQVESDVQVPLDLQVAGHPGAGEAQFARFEQETTQGPAVAYDQNGRVGRARLRTVPGADAHRERGPQQLFDKRMKPRCGVSHDAHLRDGDPGMS